MNSAFTAYLSISVHLFWGSISMACKAPHHSRASVVLQILAVPHVNLLQSHESNGQDQSQPGPYSWYPFSVLVIFLNEETKYVTETISGQKGLFWFVGFPDFSPQWLGSRNLDKTSWEEEEWVEGRERGEGERKGRGGEREQNEDWEERGHLLWKLLQLLIMTICVFLFEWPNLGVNLFH